LIENLQKGDSVKTYKHGFQPIVAIGKRDILHPSTQKNQLYRCLHEEVFGDLVLTGCHAVLVPFLKDETQWEHVEQQFGCVYETDDLFRLPVCLDDRAVLYENEGVHTIYHIALEHPDYYMNYGIYAQGLLVESSSQRYLKELSGMELIE
jgi:hypothetical protein